MHATPRLHATSGGKKRMWTSKTFFESARLVTPQTARTHPSPADFRLRDSAAMNVSKQTPPDRSAPRNATVAV
jgi:hypothetical protein